MVLKRLGLLGLLGLLGIATAACSDGYGYGGLDAGYGAAGYYGDGYGYGAPYGYSGYGYDGFGGAGFGSGFGWYNSFYYPGTGIYVYDNNRRRYRWNDSQRRYWEGRRGNVRGGRGRENWADFARNNRQDQRDYRNTGALGSRQGYQAGTADRGQTRDERQAARREFRQDARRDYRQARRENRVNRGNPGAGVSRSAGPRSGGGRRQPR